MTIDRIRDGEITESSRSAELRMRKREIINKIHNSSWILESLLLIFNGIVQSLEYFETGTYISQSISATLNLMCHTIFIPFLHLFNEHSVKIMILEHGWFFAMKNAIRLSPASRMVPQRNRLNTTHPRNVKTLRKTTAWDEDVSPKQRAHKVDSNPMVNTKSKIANVKCLSSLHMPSNSKEENAVKKFDKSNPDEEYVLPNTKSKITNVKCLSSIHMPSNSKEKNAVKKFDKSNHDEEYVLPNTKSNITNVRCLSSIHMPSKSKENNSVKKFDKTRHDEEYVLPNQASTSC